jgi:hypothetical protein
MRITLPVSVVSTALFFIVDAVHAIGLIETLHAR